MATRRDRAGRRLREVGACFAGSSDKYVAVTEHHTAKPAYHIHPSAAYPHDRFVLRFETIAALEQWIREMERN